VWPEISEILSVIYSVPTNRQPIWLTGHSQGAALALLAGYLLATDPAAGADPEVARTRGLTYPLPRGYPIGGLYLYGCPRVGNHKWAKSYDKVLGEKTWRIVNHADAVPLMPPPQFAYFHCGKLLHLQHGALAEKKDIVRKKICRKFELFF
jgi:triacylglycerol lipase